MDRICDRGEKIERVRGRKREREREGEKVANRVVEWRKNKRA